MGPAFEHPISYRLDHGQGDPKWRIRAFEHRQAFNRCHPIQLDLMSLAPEEDPRELLGQRLSLRILRGSQQQVHSGIVVAVQEGERQRDSRLATVRVEAALALLGKNIDSRIFQDQSPLDILRELIEPQLQAQGSALVLLDLRRGRNPRDYCVQFEESDLSFMERLLAESGINYSFDYDDRLGAERVLLFDELGALPRSVMSPDAISVVQRSSERARARLDPEQESVEAFRRSESIAAHSISLHHWDWKGARLREASSERSDRLELIQPLRMGSSRRDAPQEMQRRVKEQLETVSQGQKQASGTSESLAFVLGTRFAIESVEQGETQSEYVVHEILHRGQCPEWLLEASSSVEPPAANYQNHFQCGLAKNGVRPSIARRRSAVFGPQCALVCGPRAGEVHVDAQGRVALAFDWDRLRDSNERRQCWVRVAQSWAGAGWGSFFVPRVGSEVIVVFLNGDPERPVVVGGLHNPTQPPPFALPGCKTQSGIKTRSTGGSTGHHELRFDDQRGREEVYLKSQRNLRIHAGGNKQEIVARDSSVSLGGDQRLEVGGESCVEVGNHQRTLIQGDLEVHCQGTWQQEIGVNSVQKVKGQRTVGAFVQEFESEQGLYFRCTQGGAQMDLKEHFLVRAAALTVLCGDCRIHVDPDRGITLDAASTPFHLEGESIHLNCK